VISITNRWLWFAQDDGTQKSIVVEAAGPASVAGGNAT
jgi:hypothetical protein